MRLRRFLMTDPTGRPRLIIGTWERAGRSYPRITLAHLARASRDGRPGPRACRAGLQRAPRLPGRPGGLNAASPFMPAQWRTERLHAVTGEAAHTSPGSQPAST